MCSGMDRYLVGYRNEESAPLGSEERVRTVIPSIAAHCLPRGSSPPDRLGFPNLDDHDAIKEDIPLSALAFTWDKFAPLLQFLTGAKVLILKSTGRKTGRSSQTQPDVCTGGSLWLPGDSFKYNKHNSFGVMNIGQDLESMEDTWDVVKAAAKQELNQGVTLKDILNHGRLKDWKELFLSKAITVFMEYYEDEIQDIPEADVETALLKAMTLYRRERQTAFNSHTIWAQGLKDVAFYNLPKQRYLVGLS